MKKTEKELFTYLSKIKSIETLEDFKSANLILNIADKEYNESNPSLTDTEFDELLFKTVSSPIAETYPVEVLSKVSEASNKKPKVHHQYRMLSLQKANKIGDVKKFLNKFSDNPSDLWYTNGFIVETKDDGLTSVFYKHKNVNDGKLTISSRGDGEVGTDNTDIMLPTLSSKALNELSKYPNLTARGESIINDSAFDELNINGDFQNSRNLVSGTLQSLDTNLAKERKVMTHFYNLENAEELGINSELEMLSFLSKVFGRDYITVPFNKEGSESTKDDFSDALLTKEEVISVIKGFDSSKRDKVPHTIDGLVIKPNFIKNRREIGFTEHHPKNQLAFKFPADVATTTLTDVVWQVGAKGLVTPVGVVEPVLLSGSTITRASLANLFNIRKRDIRIGDTVFIQKANDVIPQIIKPIVDERDGSEIEVVQPEKTFFKNELLYTLVETEEQLLNRWKIFVGKTGLDIDALSKRTVKTLADNNLINLKDFLSLWSIDKEEFIDIPSLGEKKYNKLISELEKAKTRPTKNILVALGLPGIGNDLSKQIMSYFGSARKLLDSKEIDKDLDKFRNEVDSIGEQKVLDIKNNLLSDENKKTLLELEKLGFSLSNLGGTKSVSDDKKDLSGLTIVVTGKTKMKRSELKELLESYGIKLAGSISGKTEYLVTNETDSSSSKFKKAQNLGIPILTEDEFLLKLN